MNYIWAKNKKINDCLVFELNLEKECDTLLVCAVDSYQVFLDGKFIFYGPNRAPSGFIRPAKLGVIGVKKVTIKVLSYGKPCYACDFQEPFFGAMLTKDENEVYSTCNFDCFREDYRLIDMPRYSRQRGFAEGYDFNLTGKVSVETAIVSAPKQLNIGASRSEYKTVNFIYDGCDTFNGFEEIKTPWWSKNPAFAAKDNDFDISRDFLPRAIGKFKAIDFHLENERTGFIKFSAFANEPTEMLVVFDEFLPDGKWTFARGACNDYIYIKIPAGKTEFISREPYAFKFLKVIVSNGINIDVSLITYENDFKTCVSISGDASVEKVLKAAENTFRQNAVDLFTDCPGRERAGWLCDSFFTAKAERFFTGKNEIEKNFIENFILATTPEIPDGMLPMCFPSEHDKNCYIPNWSLWFILEIYDYFIRTGDTDLVNRAKDKIYGIIRFFDEFINEYGLLENLKSWVFVEWSICNDPEYVKGVNFPSNMLYSLALKRTGELFNDFDLIDRAKSIDEQIVSLSFNGQFFVDNAVRENGKLIACKSHLSETCQYYALFTGLCSEKNYAKTIIEKFGPFRKDEFPEVGKSNAFIGNYLRLFWLCSIGEYDRVLDESVEYFTFMAEKTGTLWEHDSPKASCCHGFASVVAALILQCVCGYVGVKDNKPIIDESYPYSKKYNLKIDFEY